MSPSRTAPPPVVAIGAGRVALDAWQAWTAVFQAQVKLLNRLTLLYRHAAHEYRCARSPVELLSIHLNVQKAIAQDWGAFGTDCLRGASGQPLEGAGDTPDHLGRVDGAVGPVLDAITEPMVEGMKAMVLATTAAPAALGDAQPGATGEGGEAEAEPQAGAGRRSQGRAAARKAAPARSRRSEKPQARREPARKQTRPRGRK